MSNEARKTTTIGEIVNLMSVDSQRVQNVMRFLWILWSAPFLIALSMYFLWGLLGASVLAGVAVIILLIPINAVIARVQRMFQVR